MSLGEFLVWIASSGGAIVAVSFFSERSKKFQALTADQKQWFMFVASALLALGAFAIQQFVPAEVLVMLAPWFAIVATTFTSLFISKAFHKVDKQ